MIGSTRDFSRIDGLVLENQNCPFLVLRNAGLPGRRSSGPRRARGVSAAVLATKTKGARAGFTSVLHTWGRQMQHHPHVHIIIPAVAYHPKRLIGYDAQGRILLRWTPSNGSNPGVLRLHPHEFLRRWLLHVLPKGFTRIRHYGFLSSAAKKTRLRIRLMLGAAIEAPPDLPEPEPFTCGHCGGSLTFLREIAPSMFARGPPASVDVRQCRRILPKIRRARCPMCSIDTRVQRAKFVTSWFDEGLQKVCASRSDFADSRIFSPTSALLL